MSETPLTSGQLSRPRASFLLPAAFLWLAANAAVALWTFARTAHRFALIKAVYDLNTIWIPIACAVLGAAIAAGRVPRFSAIRRGAAGACVAFAAICAAVRVYATHIEPRMLTLRTAAFASPDLPKPLRILHVTDIQCGSVGPYEERAFAMMREQEADLILITGDFIHPLRPATIDSEWPKLAALLRTLEAPLGVYAVLGDVDGPLRERLLAPDSPVRTLEGQSLALEWGGAPVRLHGLTLHTSRFLNVTRLALRDLAPALAEPGFHILFGHAPDFILAAKELPIDLCLAGHTHGGQIRIPGWGPILTLSTVPRHLARGFHEVGRTRLNVSAGIGAEHAAQLPSIRLFCPPEMTLIEVGPGR